MHILNWLELVNSLVFELPAWSSRLPNTSSIWITTCKSASGFSPVSEKLIQNSYIIANNTLEYGTYAKRINDAVLQGIFPKMPLNVITIEQALDALARSTATYYWFIWKSLADNEVTQMKNIHIYQMKSEDQANCHVHRSIILHLCVLRLLLIKRWISTTLILIGPVNSWKSNLFPIYSILFEPSRGKPIREARKLEWGCICVARYPGA